MKEAKEVNAVYFGPPGPGEVLSELAQGVRNMVKRGDMTALEGQEYYDRQARQINLHHLTNPHIPWETGSTQVRELIEEGKLLGVVHFTKN